MRLCITYENVKMQLQNIYRNPEVNNKTAVILKTGFCNHSPKGELFYTFFHFRFTS